MHKRWSAWSDFNSAQYVFNLMQNFPKNNLVIDVRDSEEFGRIHIHNSINIPYSDEYSELPGIQELREHVVSGQSLFDKRKRMLLIIVFSPQAVVFAREVYYILRRDKCREVHILEEELNVFASKYSFLCEGELMPMFKCPFDGYPSEILPFKLYLGNYHHAEDSTVIDNLKITHIVNATNSFEAKFRSKGVVYLRLGVEDLETEDFTRHFSLAYRFLREALENDKHRVLVHCARGISRSATIIILYFMKAQNMTYDQAFKFVKKHREIICPNEGFMNQLRSWELDEIDSSPILENKSECRVMIE